jgi:hypothetical protein
MACRDTYQCWIAWIKGMQDEGRSFKSCRDDEAALSRGGTAASARRALSLAPHHQQNLLQSW